MRLGRRAVSFFPRRVLDGHAGRLRRRGAAEVGDRPPRDLHHQGGRRRDSVICWPDGRPIPLSFSNLCSIGLKTLFKKRDIVDGPLKITIKDVEIFDDLILYYLKEGSALPESQISTYGLKNIKKILLTSNEEKNRQINESLNGLDKELNKIFKNA